MRDDEFYTRAEIAAEWKCSLRTVDKIISEKLLPIHRIGRSVRVKGSDAKSFGRQEATAA
tara:strand:+ start:967 stop:1146 length:180 start_codon:yes stop_codon:yes gene_type:complete